MRALGWVVRIGAVVLFAGVQLLPTGSAAHVSDPPATMQHDTRTATDAERIAHDLELAYQAKHGWR